MDHDKLSYFKKRLEEELKLTEVELTSMGVVDEHAAGGWAATVGDIDDTATEPDEVADRIEALEENQSEVAEISLQRKTIERALAKIEDGSFGLCEINGERIEEERLEANPAARTCIAHIEDEGELA